MEVQLNSLCKKLVYQKGMRAFSMRLEILGGIVGICEPLAQYLQLKN
jgi:hypothetical protein